MSPVSQRYRHALGPFLMIVAAWGCQHSEEVTGVPSNLAITNSSPAAGDATLTRIGAHHDDVNGAWVDLVQEVDGIRHEVIVTWIQPGIVTFIRHTWGAAGGPLNNSAQCPDDSGRCDPSQANLDVSAKRVSVSHLSLGTHTPGPWDYGDSANGTSTLDGSIGW